MSHASNDYIVTEDTIYEFSVYSTLQNDHLLKHFLGTVQIQNIKSIIIRKINKKKRHKIPTLPFGQLIGQSK